MALSPKERADFDEIVLRLRLEDTDVGTIQPQHRSFAMLVSVITGTLVFGLGVALVGHGVLGPILIVLPDTDWELATPAEGWAVRDQISHLAYFDDAAVQSATDPDAFQAELAKMLAGGGLSPDDIAARYRDLPPDRLLAWFDESRA